MSYREGLPQLENLFLTDGGLETTLIFHSGLDLPEFAAFDLLKSDQGAEELKRYFEPYLAVARERGLGFVLDTATWRASLTGPRSSATRRRSSTRPTARPWGWRRRSATVRRYQW